MVASFLLTDATMLLLIFEALELGWRSSMIESKIGTHEKKPNVVVSRLIDRKET